MGDPRFRSDLPVTYVEHCGSDRQIARVAWALPPGEADPRDHSGGWERLIRGMLAHNHSSPFEHGLLTVYMECPAVVWWQLTRHRFMSMDTEDFSFNLESARYKVLDGDFYVPPADRPCLEPAGFKPLRPRLNVSALHSLDASRELEAQSRAGWGAYNRMLEAGVAREVARAALPFNVYYAGYVSARPWTWLHFLRLRRSGGAVPSFPQWEIERVANKCGDIFAEHWPITWRVHESLLP